MALGNQSYIESELALEREPSTKDKVVIIGLYGVPGSGKSWHLQRLEEALPKERFRFYEGSEVIASLVTGGLDTFRDLNEEDKYQWRQNAIETIAKESAVTHQVAIVTGHFMFWQEDEPAPNAVYTQSDLALFTHIIYLDVATEMVESHRLNDRKKCRESISSAHLRKWQSEEKTQLRLLCRKHGILFCAIRPDWMSIGRVATLTRDFQVHNGLHNMKVIQALGQQTISSKQDTVLIFDGDKTLSATDSSLIFWEKAIALHPIINGAKILKDLFDSHLGYSYTAFRQATLTYEEAVNEEEYEQICEAAALEVNIYPEFKSLMHSVAKESCIGGLLVTCGLGRMWEKVLEREGLSNFMKVIGGGRISNGFVVTAATKCSIVSQLRKVHGKYVWAFGDSPLDVAMLQEADKAIVVVGKQQERSKTMDAALKTAIDQGGLQASQLLLPNNVTPRLDTTRLPIIELDGPKFLNLILRQRDTEQTGLEVLHATEKGAAKLFMTRTRDANVSGAILRDAHRQVGQYLATEYLSDLIGLEEKEIRHVQGNPTIGHQFLKESQTMIVALMRGGEPMAFGVSEILPMASFLHAKAPEDVTLKHLQKQKTIILVDSVINNGKTVVSFVDHIRKVQNNVCTKAQVRIVLVAGVVQAQCISKNGLLHTLSQHQNVNLVALRISDNKFTGKGLSDTGNRLFNTCHLD